MPKNTLNPKKRDRESSEGRGLSKKHFEMPAIEGADQFFFRGASLDNISRIRRRESLRVQNPRGRATVAQHVGSDSNDSPFISAEVGDGRVSALKYAPKPVRLIKPNTNAKKSKVSSPKKKSYKALDRTGSNYTFVKSGQKSYANKTKEKYVSEDWVGYVVGVKKADFPLTSEEQLAGSLAKEKAFAIDISDQKKAKSFGIKGSTAQNMAKGDAEVLLRPNLRTGIAAKSVSLVMKVQKVSDKYYKKNLKNRTAKKSLGVFHPGRSRPPSYFKLQLPKEINNTPVNTEDWEFMSSSSSRERSSSMSSIGSIVDDE